MNFIAPLHLEVERVYFVVARARLGFKMSSPVKPELVKIALEPDSSPSFFCAALYHHFLPL